MKGCSHWHVMRMPPLQVVRETIKDISQPSTSATNGNRSDKILLLTWHDSSTPAKDSVCDSITPRFMPQHDSNTPVKAPIYVMRQLSFEETKLDGEAGFGDVAGSIDSSVLGHDKSFGVDDLDLNLNLTLDLNVPQSETQEEFYVESGEDKGTNDDDDDFFMDEENELVEPDVDVHLCGIRKEAPFENICITSLVPEDALEGEDVDVMNADGFC
nr:hypothetical protein [Tanacetum cinerariifolium]